MKILRLILAVFISAGLALAPVQAAYAMRMSPVALMDGPTGTPPVDQDCFCCDIAARCPMTSCAMQCVQIGPASTATFRVAVVGHAAFSGFAPSMRHGLGWQPPTPPPRA